ncbi:G/U mismatch-specific DNA glycosylase [Aquibacillus rhizosphaerae]|uniref:G/U mismatch-specific DNA glycosylase n=1 Tax=Aquibacillus rhizosphaerae TaxID=3051431 RepID=A0ABT7LA13_9BACI|nr:G/U mismatch-specific DNA glycosylase [Aquibacillus sp. LR5S19]MDL4842715.1 G/U mismatch-specific DNA glycosylase [Aquibacillus sp. LR5S19]
MLKPIPDYLHKDMQVLFVGFNPSIRSAETGHHFANPNNRFWKILFEAGLTPTKLSPEEDNKLAEIGYGLTNIVARPTKEAAEITKEEYKQGRLELLEKINQYGPKVICFVGKGVYQEFSKQKTLPWGKQDQSISNGIEFVAPSSSGLVRMKLVEIIDIYKQLKYYI